MPTREITELRRTIGQLRQCVGVLRKRYGEASVVRRLDNDLDSVAPASARQRPADRSDVVVVSDTPYDPSLWEGADEEGVGGYQRGQQ